MAKILKSAILFSNSNLTALRELVRCLGAGARFSGFQQTTCSSVDYKGMMRTNIVIVFEAPSVVEEITKHFAEIDAKAVQISKSRGSPVEKIFVLGAEFDGSTLSISQNGTKLSFSLVDVASGGFHKKLRDLYGDPLYQNVSHISELHPEKEPEAIPAPEPAPELEPTLDDSESSEDEPTKRRRKKD